ncbi:MAG: helix-turn-helix domain-containing protein [Roseburia sp. 1XD42-69]
MTYFGSVKKKKRAKKGKSQEKLAEYCGVSKSTISKWNKEHPAQAFTSFPK